MNAITRLQYLLGCLILSSSCGNKDDPADELVRCSSLYFSVVSKDSGEDIIFGPDPALTIEDFRDHVTLCRTIGQNEEECHIVGQAIGSLGQAKINNKVFFALDICEYQATKIAFFDSLFYSIEFSEINYEEREVMGKRELYSYFEELYINGVLQCAPCEPQHLTVFEVDI